MTAKIHATLCGHLETAIDQMLPGATGTVHLPIPSYVIEHAQGVLVFDTGLHEDLVAAPDRMGANAKQFTAHLDSSATLGARLSGAGIDAASVDFLANSHLHFDHVGGNVELANARLLIQAAEWKAGKHPKLIAYDVYNPADFDLGQEVQELDGSYDVFGDDSVVLFPTPGHTSGHQSLRVTTETGTVVMTADTCYFRRSLEEMVTPGFGADLNQQLASMRLIAEMQANGAHLVFGHDPDQWEDLDTNGMKQITA